MSLPTSKPVQSSIRSFFGAKAPKYAPPPAQNGTQESSSALDTPPPPPSTATTTKNPTPAKPSPSPTPATTPREIPPLPTTLPPEASIRPVATPDVNALRRINALLLPVSYPEDFYKRLADPVTGRFSRVITWAHEGEEAKVVGGVVCRLEPQFPGSGSQTLYIRSLCLLAPYRSLGLVGAALDNIVATAIVDVGEEIRSVTAHVWTENEEGLSWYDARGFKRAGQPIKGYYMKLRPDTAWLVQLQVTKGSVSILNSCTATSESRSVIEPSVTAAAVNLPPMSPGPPRPTPPDRAESGQSFQSKRAETEWNDLPADMNPGLLVPPRKGGNSEPTSGESSRSSSTVRKKRDRSYPAAAFGS